MLVEVLPGAILTINERSENVDGRHTAATRLRQAYAACMWLESACNTTKIQLTLAGTGLTCAGYMALLFDSSTTKQFL